MLARRVHRRTAGAFAALCRRRLLLCGGSARRAGGLRRSLFNGGVSGLASFPRATRAVRRAGLGWLPDRWAAAGKGVCGSP